jgi:hypothetical protein
MDDAESSIARAPLPTLRTLKARTNIFMQILRFVAINLKMIRIIVKEHR